jgi:hypothetical protein
MRRTVFTVLALFAAPAAAFAQEHAHTAGMTHESMAGPVTQALPASAGQDAYGAIAEIVRILEADSTTDWSKVNLEALRQHLIDMNAVTLNATVRSAEIPGGIQVDVTGEGRTLDAIRRMTSAHTPMLDGMPDYAASSVVIPGGARFTVRAEREDDARTVARIRGLGFIGLLTEGAHHAPHHLALARGDAMAHGH